MRGQRVKKTKELYLSVTQGLVSGIHYSKLSKELEMSIGAIYTLIKELVAGDVITPVNVGSNRLEYKLGNTLFTTWWNAKQLNGKPKQAVKKAYYVPELFPTEAKPTIPVFIKDALDRGLTKAAVPKAEEPLKVVTIDTVYEIGGIKHVLIGDKLIKI